MDAQGLIEGVKLTRDQFLRTLKTFGLSPVEPHGRPFDPAVHEAVAVAETDQVEANRVVEEFLKGFLLHGRLIRAAKFSVSKPPQEAALA
ncbi:MAG: nucleotide exchange factor GrpE [Desulfobacterales bacterium]|nr:nucleotide exchange factor GrpE [Desulfobacterales bacterium]